MLDLRWPQLVWRIGTTPTLALQSQTISFGAIASQTVGTALTLSATATSGLSVSFASTTSAVCTVAGTTLSLIAGGTCTIQATQTGNSTYEPATPVSQSFTVSAENPAPIIASFFPAFVVAGSAAQNVMLTGANFLTTTTATLGGVAHAITYVNPTTITLSLTASDQATVGTEAITLTNPTPGGGTASGTCPSS